MIRQAVRHTHQIRRAGDLVIKTYRSWDRAEHQREWSALHGSPSTSPVWPPRPVRADLTARPPSITIGVVAGEPVRGRWADHQLACLATALGRLWSVPVDGLQPIGWHRPEYWRSLAASTQPPDEGEERTAYVRCRDLIDSDRLDAVLADRGPVIFGQGDPQIDNLLFDGSRIRMVDFEDAGPSDQAFELANFAEHLGNRGVGLGRVLRWFDIDPDRLRSSRVLIAAFWLLRLSPDPSGGRPARTEELRAQARRTIRLLDGEDPDHPGRAQR